MAIKFEWDELKNTKNLAKHFIDFKTAAKIFDGPILTKIDSRHDYGEERKISIGKVEEVLVIVVVHTDRYNKIRIISARKANKKERDLYEETIRNNL